MTDLEFLTRLQQELTTSPQWPDIRGVLTSADDASLSDNELRVFPDCRPDAAGQVDVFRVIIEWETRPDRVFPPRSGVSGGTS